MLARFLSIVLCAVLATAALAQPQEKPKAAPGSPPALGVAYDQPMSPEAAAAIRAALEGRLPPGSTIEVTTSDGGTYLLDERAEGVGAGLRARGDKVESGFDGSAPGATLGAGRAGATGGGAKADTDVLTFRPPSTSSPLLWVGIALIVASGVCVYLGLRRAAFVSGGLGACMIAAGSFPEAFAWIVAVAALGAGGVYLWTEWQKKQSDDKASESDRLKEALRAVVSGVAGLKESNPDAYAAVKREVEKQADLADQDVIRRLKREDGL